jgi:hypothetical protein
MCDPMSAIAAIGAIGSALYSYSVQEDLMSKQESANAQWAAYQRRKGQEEWARQEEARKRADAAREDTLNKLKPEEQKKAQGEEEQRVQQDITPTDLLDQHPELLQDKLLSGQKGAAPIIQQDIADKITQASRDARARIANLATIQSYGGSQFGLQNRAQDLFNTSSADINLQGNIRRGSLAAYNVEKGVEPIKYQANNSLGGLGGALAGIAGKGLAGASF